MCATASSPLAAFLKLFRIRFVGVNPENGRGALRLRAVHDGLSKRDMKDGNLAFRSP